MSEELLPCPFCGSEAKASKTHGRRSVWCSNQAECHNSAMYSRESWNTRQLPPEVEAVMEATREFEKKNRELQQGLCLYKDFRSAEIAVCDTIRAYDKSRRK